MNDEMQKVFRESRDEAAVRIKRCYDDGLRYIADMGFDRAFPNFSDFYEGRQWPKSTEATKHVMRPVINIVKMICRSKKSVILSVPAKIAFRAENDSPLAIKYNRFAEYIQKEMGQEELDKEAIHNGTVKGCYAYHYFWDGAASGLNAKTEGALRCESIDPLHIFFSNPQCRDEQKQKWILIASREEVESVRASADEDAKKDEICPDEHGENYYNEKEQGKDKFCTVLTRYFRVNTEVYWERATKNVLVNRARPLCPDTGDEASVHEPFTLYPIVMGSYEPREGCIYGIGEVEGIIPNQKSINFHLAMSLFNAQQLAWGKYIVLPGALGAQHITNEPGQVLVDYSKTGSGIRKMQEPVLNNKPEELVQLITNLTRAATGATEVMTGETVKANMSGAAIAALQAQAQQTVEELRDAFWNVKRRQGLVLAQFFKCYYTAYPFTYTEKDGDGKSVVLHDVFNSAEFGEMHFDVVVEAVRGSRSSSAGDINALDTLLAKGAIGVEGYINAYPEDALSNKTDLLAAISAEKASATAQMSAELESAKAALAAWQEEYNKAQGVIEKVDIIVRENKSLKEQLANTYTDFEALRQVATKRINEANAVIQKLTADGMEVARDAQEFAVELAGKEHLVN